jgi:hypothetical protein
MIANSRVEEMIVTQQTAEISQRQGAVVAGLALLLMVIPPIFASSVVNGALVPGDAATTANNILANERQFRLAILSFSFVIVLDVIVSWGLFVFFKPVNRSLSLLAAWFRLVYTAIFAAAIMNLGEALRLLLSAGTVTGLETESLQGQALLALDAFDAGWNFGFVLFGLHLLLLGYLVIKASTMPKLLGVLLLIAGFGYMFDAVTSVLFPDFGLTLVLFTFFGEVLLALWLVIKGVSDKQWAKLALRST